MGNQKLRIHDTDIDYLISSLRGEVGEVVSTWVLMRSILAQIAGLRSTDPQQGIESPQVTTLEVLADKLSDEIVARLAELGEQKVGRINFHFAQLKLGQLEEESDEFVRLKRQGDEFVRFIRKNRFRDKRNRDISHRELPPKWTDEKSIWIRYGVIVRGIVMALRLIKEFDAVHLGPGAKYLWHEMRRRRYQILMPARIEYMLMPYIRLSDDVRAAMTREESGEGRREGRGLQGRPDLTDEPLQGPAVPEQT